MLGKKNMPFQEGGGREGGKQLWAELLSFAKLEKPSLLEPPRQSWGMDDGTGTDRDIWENHSISISQLATSYKHSLSSIQHKSVYPCLSDIHNYNYSFPGIFVHGMGTGHGQVLLSPPGHPVSCMRAQHGSKSMGTSFLP